MFFFFLPGDPEKLAPRTESAWISEETLTNHGLEAFKDWNRIGDNLLIQRLPNTELGPGLFIAPRTSDGEDPPSKRMTPEIVWRHYKPKNHYIGYLPEAKPMPSAFQRFRVHHRYFVEDESGGEWFIPCVQSPDPDLQSLPSSLIRDFETGELTTKVKVKYRDIWDLTGQIVDRFKAGNFDDLEWCYEAALQILRVNYYIPDSVPALLEEIGCSLLDDERCFTILALACDWPLRKEYIALAESEDQKKRNQAADSLNVSPGQQGDSESRDPQEVS